MHVYDKLIENFQKQSNQVTLSRIKCDEQQEIANEFNIRKYPTVTIFHKRNLKIISKLIEPSDYEMVRKWIIEFCN